MKKVLLTLMVALPTILFAQKNADNYTLKGKIGTLNAPARAYLVYEHGGKSITDSTIIKDGIFSFQGMVTEPVAAFVVIDPAGVNFSDLKKGKQPIDAINLYLEKANIVLSPVDTIANAEVSGSKVNNDNKKLKDLVAPFALRAKLINDEYNAANEAQQLNPLFQDNLQARSKIVQTEETEALKGFIAANPQSYVSLTVIQSLVRSGMSVLDIEGLYTGLVPAVKQTELGVSFAAAIKELKFTAVGSPAPDFTQNDVDGTPVSLSSFKGKYVLLDFWASWCGPCRQENPHVVRVYDKYKDKNFTILSVSLDKPEAKAAWLKAIKDDGLSWTQVSDLKFWDNAAATLYNVSFIPQNYLIGPDGKIVAKNLKGAELDAKLLEIFKM